MTGTMKCMCVPAPGKPFELVQKPIPTPKENEVLIKVQACGICHSDMFVKEGIMPGIEYPRVPGHEVVGVVVKRGPGVGDEFKENTIVGVGWHGGHCFACDNCRKGDFIACVGARVTGLSSDGGYAEYMVARKEALALIPPGIAAAEAAPLLCAGVTVFNSIRHMNVQPGDLCAVQGIGGLGHLAIQYAAKMGLNVVALSSGKAKESLAKSLGAKRYFSTSDDSYLKVLQALGGCKLIVCTAPYAKAIEPLVDALAVNGTLLIVGAAENISVNPVSLIMKRTSIRGWPSGTAMDSQETLNVSVLQGVKPMIETMPLVKAEEAYKKMIENKARFRVVLIP